MNAVQLPIKNDRGYYEIRLESIGGLGANLCTKMLGELGIRYLGLNSISFSSYGSEKTGTPVKGYVRYSADDKDIRVNSPVINPHLLCIFHDALMNNSEILKGCNRDTTLVINTEMSADDLKKYFEKQNAVNICKVLTVPGQKIAMETHSRINVVMLGAMAKAMGFTELKYINQICEDTLGRKYPDALSSNLNGIKRGYEETAEQHIFIEASYRDDENIEENYNNREQPEWGYDTAPVGGINPVFGNSVINDLSPSRQGYIPIFLQDKCINCGLCDSTCPDMVFQFKKGIYKDRQMMVNSGLDYYHCKGCLRCVSVCPTQALVKGLRQSIRVRSGLFLIRS